jgi:hypothetical protein
MSLALVSGYFFDFEQILRRWRETDYALKGHYEN